MQSILKSISRWLLIIPANEVSFGESSSCVSEQYYGTYGGSKIYISTIPCLEQSSDILISSNLLELPTTPGDLVWIQRADESDPLNDRAPDDKLDKILKAIMNVVPVSSENKISTPDKEDQKILAWNAPIADILYRAPSSALLSIQHPYSKQLDLILPKSHTAIVLPDEPYIEVPVPEESIAYLHDLLMAQKYEEEIAFIVNNISMGQMEFDISYLTGESEESPIKSRHSLSKDVRVAADWLQGEMESTGAKCFQRLFLADFAPNIIWSVFRTQL